MSRPPVDAPSAQVSLWSSQATHATIVLSVFFFFTGAVMAFFGPWLHDARGLNDEQIAWMIAAPQFARIVIGPFVAFYADGAPDHQRGLQVVAWGSLFAYAAFFFLADGFWSLLILGFIALCFSQSLTPLTEAALSRAAAPENFGKFRGVASAVLALSTFGVGMFAHIYGRDAIMYWLLGSLLLLSLTSMFFRPDRENRHFQSWRDRLRDVRELSLKSGFVKLVLAFGFIQASHAFFLVYSVRTWDAQGFSRLEAGLFWAVGGVAEAALYIFCLGWMITRISVKNILIIGGMGAVLRWIGLGFAPPIEGIVPLQLLHALSFAAVNYAASMAIKRHYEINKSAIAAQVLNTVLSLGVFMATLTLTSGYLRGALQAQVYWLMAAAAIAGVFIALLIAPKCVLAKPIVA